MFQAAVENDPRRPVKDHQSTFKNTGSVGMQQTHEDGGGWKYKGNMRDDRKLY